MKDVQNINKTEYRKITPEENFNMARLQGIAFSYTQDEKAIRDKIEKGEVNTDNTYGAVEENGNITAGMYATPFTMWFDGQKVSMCGIGGVASLPESRRQGNIRKIFEKVFDDIYENGTVFSHLYPFSYDYYRKFGYEHCGMATRYKLPIDCARKLKNNGSAYEFIKDDDVKIKLTEIYETYASRHNIMISRSQKRWNEVFNISLLGLEHLYYWKDAENNIKSWAKLKNSGDTIEIIDIAWIDHESMLGILQFVGMFEGAAKKMAFRASPEFIAELYWNNIYEIETENNFLGMNRIVNAKRALELMKKPDGDGKFVIKINDEFAEWNNRTYSVEYGFGESLVKEISAGADIDIEVSERALTQMILGTYDFEQIAKRNDARIDNNTRILKEAFCKKPLLMADYF